jgi:hypothetical protein
MKVPTLPDLRAETAFWSSRLAFGSKGDVSRRRRPSSYPEKEKISLKIA